MKGGDFRTSFRGMVLGLAALLHLPLTASARDAAEPAVMQMTVLDAHGKSAEYLQLVSLTIARQHQVAPGIKTRIFRGSFAGEQTGLLYIILEYPSMEFMVEAQRKLAADPEWDRLRRDVGLKTGRTLISDSLFLDVTP
jgi:hypothetical protein